MTIVVITFSNWKFFQKKDKFLEHCACEGFGEKIRQISTIAYITDTDHMGSRSSLPHSMAANADMFRFQGRYGYGAALVVTENVGWAVNHDSHHPQLVSEALD